MAIGSKKKALSLIVLWTLKMCLFKIALGQSTLHLFSLISAVSSSWSLHYQLVYLSIKVPFIFQNRGDQIVILTIFLYLF